MTNEAQHILDSGDLELYALGLLDAARSQTIEAALQKDAELRDELKELQSNFEEYAKMHAEPPAPALRDSILSAAFAAEKSNVSDQQTTSPQQASSTSATRIIRSAPRNYYRYAVAASVACVISTGAAGYFWYQQNQAQLQLNDARFELATLKNDQQVMAARLDMQDKHLALMHDQNVRVVNLQATATAPAGSASVVMWNRETHEVYLEGHKLPANLSATDYQLWALVDGKPVDLGTFNTADPLPLAHMKSTARADAFAITLEPKGGSASPTLTKMIVLGKAS